MPYIYKNKVFDAVIVPSLLYGCESWWIEDMEEVNKFYLSAIKSIIGVRDTTRNDTVLVESDMPSVKGLDMENIKCIFQTVLG